MRNRKKIIFILISLVAILFPVGFLMGIINEKVAFPIMFTILGFQQLFNGVFITPRDNKKLRVVSIIFGVSFILFGIFIVFPSYY